MPNLPLLRQVLRHIDAFPDQWNQEVWAQKTDCGTTCCIAGWACVISGFEIDWCSVTLMNSGSVLLTDRLTTGKNICIQAREILGLTSDEGGELFASGNTREDIEGVANEIAERAGEPLWAEEPEPDFEPELLEMAVC